MAAISDPFATFGLNARSKLLILGSSDLLPVNVMDRVRSLNLEHVSPTGLMRSEISRRRAPCAVDEAILAPLRRWFFARKPDAGFVLTDFPATLLQAQVFDEWLDVRGEALDAVLPVDAAVALAPVAEHYRTLGLLLEPVELPPAT